MSKLHQVHLSARRGVAGAGCQIRKIMSTRRNGRRAVRGMVLLASLLGSLAALAAGGVPALAAGHVRAASAFPPAAAHHRTSARGAASPGAAALGKVDYKRVCTVAPRGHAACLALIRTNVPQHRQPVAAPNSPPVGVGYGPPSLQNAYQLPSSTAGSGQTVAVVDAYDDPHAAADLAAYRAAWGLPPCGAGCFTKVNEHGQTSPLPAPDAGWALEESLDLDMVSAICPHCHIVLVEANSNSLSDLGTGVNAAVALGARFVSNSYGGGEFPAETALDGYYNHPGVAVTVAAGDSGFGVAYPAASRYVTSVGGTTLFIPLRHITWSETVWGGTGSGCSLTTRP